MGREWDSTDTTMRNVESFSQCSVSLGELSMELKEIGMIDMSDKQITIQLVVQLP
jgi:hypothetical protein